MVSEEDQGREAREGEAEGALSRGRQAQPSHESLVQARSSMSGLGGLSAEESFSMSRAKERLRI